MEKVRVNSKLVKGDFFGGEIEPGTFHVGNVANSSGDNSMLPVQKSVREDLDDIVADQDALSSDVPVSEGSVI